MLSALSLATLALFTASPQAGPEPERLPMSVDDALDMVRLGDVCLSPDGEWVFYSERRLRWAEKEYERRYFLISSRGGEARTLIGEAGGRGFQFSPDGRWLTFLRDREGEPQLHALPLDGGEARALSDHPRGIDAYRWSPAGGRVFFTAEEPLEEREQEALDAGEDAVFVGEGPNDLELGRWSNLWRLEVESGEEHRLTDEELTIDEFDVSPDGRRVVFTANRDNRTNYFHFSELYLVDAEGGAVQRLTENQAPEEGPRWAPDGLRIAYRAPHGDWFDLRSGYIWILDTATGQARKLEGQRQGEVGELFWSADGRRLLFDESQGVDTNLYALTIENDELEALTSWPGTVRSRAFSADRARWVYSFEDFDSPPDLYAARLGGAEPVRLTRANPLVEEQLTLGRCEVVRWQSADGRSIEGVLALPADTGKPTARPLMMDIHGGPPGFWGNSFEADFHLWTGLGWAVFAPNPRGSSSYGDEHLRALMGDVGGGELDDLLSGVDYLVERGVADPERLALRGWSWGGILGAWTIAHTDRFRAASLGAMVGDWSAETGGGLMYDLALHYIGSWPWEDPLEWLRRSALTYVSNVSTPTILLHGERDDVSTVNQSAMFYTALRGLGVPVRFVAFPRQGHDIREPRLRRIAAVEEIRWMARHVLGQRWSPPRREAEDAPPPPDRGWLEPGRELSAFELNLVRGMEAARVPGLSAAVIADGELLWSGGFGWADLEARLPVRADTQFQLASVSKTVTACALLQLCEEGVLELDQDINSRLPFEVRHPAHPDAIVTLRQLLTHTAGLQDNWDLLEGTWVTNGDFPVALGSSLESYLVPGGSYYDAELNFQAWAPGERHRYSNVGVALAAYVAEAASGRAFEDLCEERIFAPLGMEGSAFRLAQVDIQGVAMPYEWSREGGFERQGHHGYLDFPSGTLRTSAPQLARFLLGFVGDGEIGGVRLLEADTVHEMRRVQFPELDPDQGLVWYAWELDGMRLLGHDGGDPGVATSMFYRPSDGVGFVLLMNGAPRGRGAEEALIRRLLEFASEG